MEILGIGPLELFFIIIIALIVLGPNDMVKAGRTLGRWLRKLIKSEAWHTMQQTSQNLRTLPTRLIREAGLEEDELLDKGQVARILGWEDIKKEMTVQTDPVTVWPATDQEAPAEPDITLASPPPPGAIPYEAPEETAERPADGSGAGAPASRPDADPHSSSPATPA